MDEKININSEGSTQPTDQGFLMQNEDGWNNTIDGLYPRLFRYFRASFIRDLSYDLVQETFVRLIERDRKGGIDLQKGNRVSFAFGIAHNLRKETLRSNKNVMVPFDDEFENTDNSNMTNSNAMAGSEISSLRKYIECLDAPEKEVILLLIDKDLTLRDISNVTSMPEATVASHISRAKQKLRKLLTKEGGV